MSRKKTVTVEEAPAPKKRATKKKADMSEGEVVGAETETEGIDVDDGDAIIAETPIVKSPQAVTSARTTEKPARTTIAELVPTVRLALVEAHATLPTADVVADAFALHYAAARTRFEQGFGDIVDEVPMVVAALPPAVTATFEPETAPLFDLASGFDDAPEEAPPTDGPFEMADDAFATEEPLLTGEVAAADETEPPSLLVAEDEDDDVSEATIHFNPSDLIAAIDGTEAQAPEPTEEAPSDEVMPESTVMIAAIDDEADGSDSDGATDTGAAATDSSGGRKSKKNKRKR